MELLHGEARLDAALDELAAYAAVESRVYAATARALVRAAEAAREVDVELGQDCTTEFLPIHVAGTLTVGQGAATSRLEQARHLVVQLPETWRALDEGWLRVHVARVLVEETSGRSPALCSAVEAEVFPWAQDRTAGEVRRRVRRVLLRLEEQAEAERRRRQAVADRAVSSTPLPDGMAGVWATMPAAGERLFSADLRQLAERVRQPGDQRTAAQRESDVLASLPGLVLAGLTGGLGQAVQEVLAAHGFRPGGRRTELAAVLLVPAATALGRSEEPAELVGHGPVTAAHARELLTQSTVRSARVDARTGRVLSVDQGVLRPGGDLAGVQAWLRARISDHHAAEPAPAAPGYRATAALRRFLQLRDQRCVGIGCSRPATHCDVEHRVPWPHGPTDAENTALVSRRCHRAKQAGWSYRRTRDGTTWWTSPGGRTYRRPADDLPAPAVDLTRSAAA